jgi:inner membrane transporter RhtA
LTAAGEIPPAATASEAVAAVDGPPAPAEAARLAARLDGIPPELLIVTGTLSVQCGAGIATSLLRQYGPLPVVSMRIVFGTLMLLAVQPLRLRGVSRAALASGLLLGAVLATMNSSFYVGLSRIPLGVAVTIEFWGPLTVAVLGSRRPRDLLWVGLAAAGIYSLAGGRLNADDAIGVLAVIVAGGCWATYILTGRRMARHWPDGRGLSLGMLVASLLVIPTTLLLADVRPLLAAPLALGAGLIVALFSSAIPYTAEIAALRRLPAATFGVLMSLEPAIAAIVGFVFLGQVLDLTDIAAIACVALASAGASLSARRLATTPGELEAA